MSHSPGMKPSDGSAEEGGTQPNGSTTVSHGSSAIPFATSWTDEKSASVDWTNPEDVAANNFTFLQLLSFHPQLREHMGHDRISFKEKEKYISVFLNPMKKEAQKELITQWMGENLLTLRDARWCRYCGKSGHTRRTCPLAKRESSTSTADGNEVALPRDTDAPTHAPVVTPEEVTELLQRSKSAGEGDDVMDKVDARQQARRLTVIEKFHEHKQMLERQKLIQEKQHRNERQPNRNAAAKKGFGAGSRAATSSPQRRPRGAGGAQNGAPQGDHGGANAVEERRRGAITRLDVANGIGFVNIPDLGEVKFFTDRLEYGIKEARLGDIVTLKIDYSRDYPIASDVRPEKSIIAADDVTKFIARCKVATRPVLMIRTLLMYRHEWSAVVQFIASVATGFSTSAASADANRSGDVPSAAGTFQEQARVAADQLTDAVYALVNLTTFIENREPIHIPLLHAFLTLLCSQTAYGSFFPQLLVSALDAESRMISSKRSPYSAAQVDQWAEVVNLGLLMRQSACSTTDALATVEKAVGNLLTGCANHKPALRRSCMAALWRMKSGAGMARQEISLIPTAQELQCPPPNEASVFAPSNLPVNGKKVYENTEDFITDHCKLLRADTFESASRLIAATCFQLPGVETSSETSSDVEHARVFNKVRYMGRVITDDRDFAYPDSYILQVQPKSARANIGSQLHQGTAVCITTGIDRTTIDENEIFWGTVSSCDSVLLESNMIVVTRCEGSTAFSQLALNLLRNEEKQVSDTCSLLLETAIFMPGYQSIFNALKSFVGPLAMQLPLSSSIVSSKRNTKAPIHNGEEVAGGEEDESNAANTTADVPSPEANAFPVSNDEQNPMKSVMGLPLVSYVPPHCESAFRFVVDRMRRSCSFDRGQESVMKRLPTSEVLLVQGPPGTGKSFTGCRVVETYIRYKQLLASGDALNYVDVGLLPSMRVNEITPTLGPTVVITFKNHALDEFLVDLLKSNLWTGDSQGRTVMEGNGKLETFPHGRRLVRIGGRSREPNLEPYNLGTLMRSRADKSVIIGQKDRLRIMNQRLQRLNVEIQQLERGRLNHRYFDRWLTAEQRESFSSRDLEEWLSGGRYVGEVNEPADKNLFRTLIRSRIATEMGNPSNASNTTATSAKPEKIEVTADPVNAEDEVPQSVFQQMKQEDEYREYNNSLHTTYISAEALSLTTSPPTMPANIPSDLQSLWSLSPVTRHQYLAYLIKQSIASKAGDCLKIIDAISNTIVVRNHATDEARLQLLQGADVIGLTTTGCAMNQNLLRSLRPSMLLVEEAAEVLEPQLLACMTDSLQQIILIGDHFQLKPKIDTFLYEKVNRMNISMFERLAEQRLKPIRLVEQRRMHPDLSQLIRPFYKGQRLEDHPLLLTRGLLTANGDLAKDYVPGLAHRLFFWRHSHPEEEAPGSRSKINTKEISMVHAVVAHLVEEGVLPKSITVITPYLGQCRAIRNVLRLHALRDVQVSTVDLFQGDENDVIVLSLVRTAKLTEFIRMRNRLIVACSRARFALILIGSDVLLEQVSHWAGVIQLLRKKGCISDELPVTDREHPGRIRMMRL